MARKRNPELINEENPEWTDEMFARAVPFSGLPKELQDLLSQPMTVRPDSEGRRPSEAKAH